MVVAKRGKRVTEEGASTCEDVVRFTRRSVERLPHSLPRPLSRRWAVFLSLPPLPPNAYFSSSFSSSSAFLLLLLFLLPLLYLLLLLLLHLLLLRHLFLLPLTLYYYYGVLHFHSVASKNKVPDSQCMNDNHTERNTAQTCSLSHSLCFSLGPMSSLSLFRSPTLALL